MNNHVKYSWPINLSHVTSTATSYYKLRELLVLLIQPLDVFHLSFSTKNQLTHHTTNSWPTRPDVVNSWPTRPDVMNSWPTRPDVMNSWFTRDKMWYHSVKCFPLTAASFCFCISCSPTCRRKVTQRAWETEMNSTVTTVIIRVAIRSTAMTTVSITISPSIFTLQMMALMMGPLQRGQLWSLSNLLSLFILILEQNGNTISSTIRALLHHSSDSAPILKANAIAVSFLKMWVDLHCLDLYNMLYSKYLSFIHSVHIPKHWNDYDLCWLLCILWSEIM